MKKGTKLHAQGQGHLGRTVYVPEEIAKHVPENARFRAELTEEGILFRFLPEDRSLPSWAIVPVSE